MKPRFWNKIGLSGIKLLIAVLELGGEAWIIDALDKAGMGHGVMYKIVSLQEVGLAVFEEVRVEGRVRTYVKLTPLGLRIAEHLRTADELAPDV
jgi:DNA-binding PadR family transcriptional regulator